MRMVAEVRPDYDTEWAMAAALNRCWVADFTHVATFSGVVHVAFVVDTFSRWIVGWSASTTKQTRLVLDALDMGLWQRDRDQNPPMPGELIHHPDADSQGGFNRSLQHRRAPIVDDRRELGVSGQLLAAIPGQ